MTAEAPRVLFYSHNGVGVGHFRRQLKLARVLRERVPGAVVLMATGSHSVEALNGPFGFECVSLPSIRMIDRYENWDARHPGMTRREVMRLRADLLRRTVRRFRPDLLVADFMPAGPYGELIGALEELRATGGRAVAGFRDIIDAPEFVRDLWERTGVKDVLREHYDAIWVYGVREVTDFARDYGLDGELEDRTRYLGYLVRRVDEHRRVNRSSAPVITASTGGGADGGALLSTFISAMRALPSDQRTDALVVAGPLLADEQAESLRRAAADAGLRFAHFLAGLDRRIAFSDVVVTMPGYNGSCELLSSRAKAVVVPRSGPSQEQRMRAVRLAEWGRARIVAPDELGAEALAEALARVLAEGPPPAAPVASEGLARVGEEFARRLAGAKAGTSG